MRKEVEEEVSRKGMRRDKDKDTDNKEERERLKSRRRILVDMDRHQERQRRCREEKAEKERREKMGTERGKVYHIGRMMTDSNYNGRNYRGKFCGLGATPSSASARPHPLLPENISGLYFQHENTTHEEANKYPTQHLTPIPPTCSSLPLPSYIRETCDNSEYP